MVEQKDEEEEEEGEEEGEAPREEGMQKVAGTFFTPVGGRPMAIDACLSTSLASSPITTAFASPSSCSSSSLHSSPHRYVLAALSGVVIGGRAGGGMNDESYASSSSSSSSFNDSDRGGGGGGGGYLPTLQLHPHQQRSLDVTSAPQCPWAVGTAGSLPGTPLRQQWAKAAAAAAAGEGLQGSGFGGGDGDGGGGGWGDGGRKKPTHRRSVAVVHVAGGQPTSATAGQEEGGSGI
jgi:hypothetical protein